MTGEATNPSFKLADAVLCDDTGDAFGAPYLGKKLAYLTTPSEESAAVVKKSSNSELMSYFQALKLGEIGRLPAPMVDHALWAGKREEYSAISDRCFEDYPSTSAKKTVEIIRKFGTILERED